ncbi:type IV pilus modification PilV family protein [Aeoliella sp. SH292]|uniref:type IV pilus modification PilV family protein n=1 Tax=Aeoliella sp. SH292 TaxID=3454464 RepID=UPI003F96F404
MQLFIPSPQTLASSPSPRHGVTLTEVLISIGILAVGLLGAAAMFPVGSYFMQKGEVADRGAAIAQAAFADLVARGDLNPENWRAWDAPNGVYQPMGQAMRNWMSANAAVRINSGEADYQTQMNAAAGFVYIIDPLGTAGAFRAGDSTLTQLTMAPMRLATPMDFSANEFDGTWPVRRLCTKSMVMGNVLPSEPVARSLYMSGDDIAFDLPEEGDNPSQQQVIKGQNSSGDTVAVARQNRGDYSWMAMVAPTQSDAREAIGLNPSAYYFDVSVIVFYKRPIASISTTESLVKGYIVSTGTGGGEILLDSDPLTDAYDDFKVGQWVMVSAPHPSSSEIEPLFFSQWYRVLSINDTPDNQGNGPAQFTNETTQRRIGLRGPDWPWKTAGTPVRVGIFPGAVAVHTKTMRLESQGPYSR